jgi:hypothetical protein
MSSSDSWCLVGLVLESEVGGDGAVDLADEVSFEFTWSSPCCEKLFAAASLS